MFKTIIKKLTGEEEERLKRELRKKDRELGKLRSQTTTCQELIEFNIAAWQKIYDEDKRAVEDAQKEITGLMFMLDQKDAEIEDLKEQIRRAAS